MSDALPRLRPLEAFPVEHEGQRMIALRDPAGLTSSIVMLPGPLLEIVSLFDGAHTTVDVQAVVMRQHGQLVTAAEIESVVASLDEHGFLATPRFAARVAEIEAEFRQALTRPAPEARVARARQYCFGAELVHRGEHSIEFQAVFIRYLFGGRRDFTIVPILTSFAHDALARGKRPEDDRRVARFLDAVVETAAAQKRRVAFVAGADLAHMGPRFGDPT